MSGLNHLTLAVADLDAALDFYVELLGFVPEARWERGAYLSAGSLWLCLALGPVRRRDDYTHVAFGVSGGAFGTLAARLIDGGATRWQPNASEGDSLYFLDPDGHRLEIHDGDLASRLAAVDAAPYAGWTRRFDDRWPPTLRAAVPEDAPTLARCARAAYAPYVHRIGREPAPMLADFGALIDAGAVRVMTVARAVAGYVVMRAADDALLLENVAVFPDRAGRGLGRRLIASAEDEARRAGLSRVTLYTNASMHENLALYPRLGYVRTGERREGGFHRVYFDKQLTP